MNVDEEGRMVATGREIGKLREEYHKEYSNEEITAGVNRNNPGNHDNDNESEVRAEMAERENRHRDADV